jgi:hypothetical protein
MRRAIVAVALVVAAVGPTAGPAAAGGSWIEFEHRIFVPGERATGRGILSVTGSGAAVKEGPFYAYLVPADQWIDPPDIPASAIPLGPIRIERIPGQAFLRQATLSFVVPVVPVGTYGIALCNRPCRDVHVGDLIGAWGFRVGIAGDHELRLVARQLRWQMKQVGARAARRVEALQQEIMVLRGELLDTRWSAERADDRSRELQSRVARLERRLVAVEAVSDPGAAGAGGDAVPWLAPSLLVTALAAWWLARFVRRRRRPPPTGTTAVTDPELEELLLIDVERDREPVGSR